MATSKKSTGDESYNLTSFAADIHASLSAQQENDEAKATQGTSGRGSEKPLASYDPDTQSWKMYGDTSLWGEQPSLASLPKSGMTRSGVLYPQPAWVPITAVIESSSWPTPTASDAWTADMQSNQIKEGSRHSVTLGKAVQMWPTPTAITRPMEGNVRLYRAKIEAGEMTEAEAEAILGKSVWEAQGKLPAMWPTPTYGKLAGGTGGMQQIEAKYLAGEISAEERRAMRAGNGGKLNPMWVEWLMGFPTGWTDLEA